MSDPAALPAFEPDDLDGHSLDELTDYLEAGFQPPNPSIDDSPACRNALAALQRLQDLAGQYLEDDAGSADIGQDWIDSVLAAIPIDARAGRRFTIEVDDPHVDAQITEGAIRGLVRAIGDDVPGLLVGSVRIGDERPASLSVDVAIVYGAVVPETTDRFRAALLDLLPDHVPFSIGPIDIHVIGVIPSASTPSPGHER
jgi:hypothetical protein